MKLLKIFLVSILLFVSCSDVVDFKESDLKVNGLDIFTPKILKLEGSHDIDNSRISLLLESNTSNEEYLKIITKNAIKNGWVLSFKKDNYIIFIKNNSSISQVASPIIVKICLLDKGLYSIDVF
jgi:hypothetical protein